MLLGIVLNDLLIDIELDARGVLPGVAETLHQVDGLCRLDLLIGQVRAQPALPAYQQGVPAPHDGQQLLQGRAAAQTVDALQAKELLGRGLREEVELRRGGLILPVSGHETQPVSRVIDEALIDELAIGVVVHEIHEVDHVANELLLVHHAGGKDAESRDDGQVGPHMPERQEVGSALPDDHGRAIVDVHLKKICWTSPTTFTSNLWRTENVHSLAAET